MSIIPLYHGYKEKELRREADRLLRRHIHLKLESSKSDLREIQKEKLKKRELETISELDDLITNIDTHSQRIDRAVHGFSGFWDAVKIKEDELDDVYDNDLGLLEAAIKTAEITSAAKTTQGSLDSDLVKLKATISEIETKLDRRERILRGMKSFE
jgi:DNA repair ATPase RecN